MNHYPGDNQQPDYQREFEDISGVKDVSAIMKNRRDSFERTLMNLQDDQTLSNLLAVGSKKDAREDHGSLQSVIMDLRDFEDRYLYKTEPFFDIEAQQRDLTIVFNKAMAVLVKKWPTLGQLGYDWNAVCHAVYSHMLNFANVFGVGSGVASSMTEWFNNYQEVQKNEAKYQQRDMLSAQALRAYSELSYFSTVGADQKVMDQVRSRISLINDELKALPVDPDNAPAYSGFTEVVNSPKVILSAPASNSNQPAPRFSSRTPINPQTEEVTQFTQRAASQSPQPAPVPQKQSWYKKIPLIGKWF